MPKPTAKDIETAVRLLRTLKNPAKCIKAPSDDMRFAYGALRQLRFDHQGILVTHFGEGCDLKSMAAAIGRTQGELSAESGVAMSDFVSALRRLMSRAEWLRRQSSGAQSPLHNKSQGGGNRENQSRPAAKLLHHRDVVTACRMLRVAPSAPLHDKRNAYIQAIKKVRPDKIVGGNARVRKDAERRSKLINNAWHVVKTAAAAGRSA